MIRVSKSFSGVLDTAIVTNFSVCETQGIKLAALPRQMACRRVCLSFRVVTCLVQKAPAFMMEAHIPKKISR